MLFKEGLIKLLVVNLGLLNYFCSYFYTIDPISYKLKFNNSKALKTKLIYKCAAAFLYEVIVLAQLIAFKGHFPNDQFYEGILFVSHIAAYYGALFVYCFSNTQMLELFNLLVQLERRFISRKLLVRNTINKLTWTINI